MPTRAELQAIATQAAAQYGVPQDLFFAQIQQESSWQVNPGPNAAWLPGQGGPVGIAQFTAGTAKQYGIDPNDPVASLYAAAKYDADLYKQHGSWATVLQKYGTVPTGGNLTPQQQAVLGLAQAKDSGGSSTAGGPMTTPAGGLPGNIQCASCTGSTIGDFLVRILVALLGLVFIWQGLAMFKGTDVVKVVVNTAKGKVAA